MIEAGMMLVIAAGGGDLVSAYRMGVLNFRGREKMSNVICINHGPRESASPQKSGISLLSPMQELCVSLIPEGSNKDIARAVGGASHNTVRTHLREAGMKLGCVGMGREALYQAWLRQRNVVSFSSTGAAVQTAASPDFLTERKAA